MNNAGTVQIVSLACPRGMRGAGLVYKAKRFVTHTYLQTSELAITTITLKQNLTLLIILTLTIISYILLPLSTIRFVVGTLSAVYFIDIFFIIAVIANCLRAEPEISFNKTILSQLDRRRLPTYSILCPLYKESRILPKFVSAIGKLDWPKNKLDVQLLLEEDDAKTIEAAKQMELPSYIRLSIVPVSEPKTKPKACNYGLAKAKGKYLVVYDAEDAPDPLQLKKAYLAFQQVPKDVVCLQAKLNYFNPTQNILTKLFTIEYSLWFDVILPGLQAMKTVIPLGGTSNHFRTRDLIKLGGWDPFNVTEDCDLGVRLFKNGGKTAIIDSVTWEEANSNLINWIRQRSRWLKGYMQTLLVYTRQTNDFVDQLGKHAWYFYLIVGGKITFTLINPFMWLMTIAYFVLRALFGPAIEALYPTPVFLMALSSLIFGNFLFIFSYMIGAGRRNQWWLIPYVYLTPLYWILVSIAGFYALFQLIFRPHYWEKTRHGLAVTD